MGGPRNVDRALEIPQNNTVGLGYLGSWAGSVVPIDVAQVLANFILSCLAGGEQEWVRRCSQSPYVGNCPAMKAFGAEVELLVAG